MESHNRIKNVWGFVRNTAASFGADTDSKAYIERDNTGNAALTDGGAYFGIIHPEENEKGPYHDFSFVIFPSDDENAWLIALCVGSLGFKDDYELAISPGPRRLFGKIIDKNGFCRTDFSDIETNLPASFTNQPSLQHLKKTIKTYTKVIAVCQIVYKPEEEHGKKIITAFIAAYAKLRDWPSNDKHREAVSKAFLPFKDTKVTDESEEIVLLLTERKYIILQGPPGTGKTRTAKNVAKSINAEIFFTQFHAETNFSDFIYGIRPELQNTQVRYQEYIGIFIQALNYAVDNTFKKVVLIIDEINRANLSNVLGPVFYLFEHKMEDSDVEIEIYPNFKVTKLPPNFFVIATMNTADRSLAVVDFALRRRFAWITLKPKVISNIPIYINKTNDNKTKFFKEDFDSFCEIFEWCASSEELNLQPGQGYFIASSDEEMKNRVKYELFSLIKEYLREGLLQNAREEFNRYFLKRIELSLYE